MELAPLVGHVVPRALVVQQEGIDELPLSPLQDSDDVQRINSMIEVPTQLAPPVAELATATPKHAVMVPCCRCELDSPCHYLDVNSRGVLKRVGNACECAETVLSGPFM